MSNLLLPQRRKACQRRLNFFYKQPNSLSSYEEWKKFTHKDLQNMTLALLKRERSRLKLRLLYDEEPSDWFLQRLDRIEERLK